MPLNSTISEHGFPSVEVAFCDQRQLRPLERFTKDIHWNGQFNSPEAFLVYYFVDRGREIIGELSGGISPMHDTFYLSTISVAKQHRHKQYELSMLINIAHFFEMPVTPMPDADRILVKDLREMAQPHFRLNPQLSAVQMAAKMRGWRQAANAAGCQPRSIG